MTLHSNKPDAPIFPKLSRKKASGRTGLSESFIALMEKAKVYREPGLKTVKGQQRPCFGLRQAERDQPTRNGKSLVVPTLPRHRAGDLGNVSLRTVNGSRFFYHKAYPFCPTSINPLRYASALGLKINRMPR